MTFREDGYRAVDWAADYARERHQHGKEIARHPRCYGEGAFIADPLHYLALIETKPNALDQAAPLAGGSHADAADDSSIHPINPAGSSPSISILSVAVTSTSMSTRSESLGDSGVMRIVSLTGPF